MDPFTMALLGSTAISGIGGLFGASRGRKDMERAAAEARAAQEQAYGQARNALTAGRDQAIGYYDPSIKSGDRARSAYEASIGLSGQDAEQAWIDASTRSPGFQAGLDRGRKQIDASAFSRGMGMSGATLKALQDHGVNYMTEWLNQRRAPLNALMAAGQGASDAAARTSYGYGSDMAGLYRGQGEDRASSYLAAGRARADSRMQPWNALTSSLNSGLQTYGYMRGRQGPQQTGWGGWGSGSAAP